MYINSDQTLPFYILKINHNDDLCEFSLMDFVDHLNIFKFLIYIKSITLTDSFGSELCRDAMYTSDSLPSHMVILEWEVMLC
jgi:hypothetical protein